MSLLGNISGKDAVTAFKKAGWIFIGQVGSHAVLTKPGSPVNLSIPQHKELGIGILRSLIKHSGLSIEDFRNLIP
jgi:predicted RNA binding protein YcfA (HicA-like mRNA interferase family)